VLFVNGTRCDVGAAGVGGVNGSATGAVGEQAPALGAEESGANHNFAADGKLAVFDAVDGDVEGAVCWRFDEDCSALAAVPFARGRFGGRNFGFEAPASGPC